MSPETVAVTDESALPPGMPAPASQITSFAGQFFIDPAKPLPHLDQGPVKAYAASASPDVPQATHYALVCVPHLTPRSRAAGTFAGIMNPNLVRLVASGPVVWLPAQGERYVFIYENTIGQPLVAEGQFRGMGWRPEQVHASVVKPLAYALMDMRDADMSHGNVRPSNMFAVSSASGIDRVMLGDCLALPSSYNQPALFATIEHAMADPIGRSPPTLESDLYALGVSVAVMLRQRDPMEGLSDEDMVRYKIEQGSYIALTGKDRFSGEILELLRGLLNDDIRQRWALEDILGWLDGQRLTPKQGAKKMKAARPVHFMDERYFRPSLLAMDLNKNQAEAVQLLDSGTMDQWVSRSLEDSAVQKRLESALETVAEQGRGPGYWDRLLCRVSIALDPDAPIRYKGVSVHPEAVGAALTEAMVLKKDIQPYIEMINNQTVLFWLTSQVDAQVDIGTIVSRFDSCRAFLRQQSAAYGLERCIYFLNPEGYCLSDRLKGFYVRDPEDMMYAFEKIAARPDKPALFFDRHIIAFLSVKDRQNIDPFLLDLNADEFYKRVLANVKTLASIQHRSRMEKFPGICRWIAEILDPVYERIHDRELRQSMKARIAQFAESGDIGKIAAALDNALTHQKDTDNYNEARREYHRLQVENNRLDRKMEDPARFAQGLGREVAALLSCVIAGITILFFIFMVLSKGALF